MEKKIFSLADLDTVDASNKGATLEITTADGIPTGILITVQGMDSDAYKEFDAEMRREANRKYQAAMRKRQDVALDSPEVSDTKKIDLLVALTIGWDGLIDKDGNQMLFSVQNAKQVYTDYPLIRRQVDEFIGDIANFTKA